MEYISIFKNNKSAVFVSVSAIRNCILKHLADYPTEDFKFAENASPEEKIVVTNADNQLIIKIYVTIKKGSDVSNNVYLLQEKIKKLIIEDTNLIPKSIDVSIIKYHDN